ncbi:MAG: replication initiator protein A, partial [Bacteroidota bacterium]
STICEKAREYFRLDGGLERFFYRLCRKVIGTGKHRLLEMNLETVYKRSGTTQKPARFRKMVAEIMEKQSIPGYWLIVIDNKDKKPVVLGIARQPGENIATGFERAMQEWRDTKRLRQFRKNPKSLFS